MKKEKRIIQVIVKSGLITWVLLLLIWQIGSLFYSDDFLPGPFTTFAGAGKLVARSFPGYSDQYAACIKRLAARDFVCDSGGTLHRAL